MKDVTKEHINDCQDRRWYCSYCKLTIEKSVTISFLIRNMGWKIIEDKADHEDDGSCMHDYLMCPRCRMEGMTPLFKSELTPTHAALYNVLNRNKP